MQEAQREGAAASARSLQAQELLRRFERRHWSRPHWCVKPCSIPRLMPSDLIEKKSRARNSRVSSRNRPTRSRSDGDRQMAHSGRAGDRLRRRPTKRWPPTAANGPAMRRGDETERAIYRVVQEALTNVARHSQARVVRVHLSAVTGTCRLIVEDDGIGFDVADAERPGSRRGLGLLGIRERVSDRGDGFEQLRDQPSHRRDASRPPPAEAEIARYGGSRALRGQARHHPVRRRALA